MYMILPQLNLKLNKYIIFPLMYFNGNIIKHKPLISEMCIKTPNNTFCFAQIFFPSQVHQYQQLQYNVCLPCDILQFTNTVCTASITPRGGHGKAALDLDWPLLLWLLASLIVPSSGLKIGIFTKKFSNDNSKKFLEKYVQYLVKCNSFFRILAHHVPHLKRPNCWYTKKNQHIIQITNIRYTFYVKSQHS